MPDNRQHRSDAVPPVAAPRRKAGHA